MCIDLRGWKSICSVCMSRREEYLQQRLLPAGTELCLSGANSYLQTSRVKNQQLPLANNLNLCGVCQ